MATKFSNFKGTRDIAGKDMMVRQFVTDTARRVFESFGFVPLQTPVIEKMETLMGKYGEEAENLLFHLAKPHEDGGLRYDHTVPLARFAGNNWQELPKPYKRYSIGPVFRGENTQAGRYREFIQCDFDTLGTNSLLVDAEIVAINVEFLQKIGFTNQFKIQIGDRRFLNALVNEFGFDQKANPIVMRAWDKLDKITLDESADYFEKETQKLNIENADKEKYLKITSDLLSIKDKTNNEKFIELKKMFASKNIQDEISNLEKLFDTINNLGVEEMFYELNPVLARGLSYYTGPIFETIVIDGGIGSISGGGRYDNLISALGGPDVPASGSSFGLDRLLDVMEKLNITPKVINSTQVLVTIYDQENNNLIKKSLEVAKFLREQNIKTEIFEGNQNLGKQFSYASDKSIPFAIVIGSDELTKNMVSIKNLETREQKLVELKDLVKEISG